MYLFGVNGLITQQVYIYIYLNDLICTNARLNSIYNALGFVHQ